MLKKLLTLQGLNKCQEKKARALAKKFSAKNKKDLGNAYDLMCDFLYENNTKGLHIILDALTQIKFTGDVHIWQYIEPCHIFKAYLSNDEEIKKRVKKLLTEEVKFFSSDKENAEYLNNERKGLSLKMSIQNAPEVMDLSIPKLETDYRHSLLTQYIKILILGPMGEMTEQECLDGIDFNFKRLRELHKNKYSDI